MDLRVFLLHVVRGGFFLHMCKEYVTTHVHVPIACTHVFEDLLSIRVYTC